MNFALRPSWLCVAAASALLVIAAPHMAAQAQGLDREGAIDAIVGSDVSTDEERIAQDEDRILAAIENTAATTAEVRRKFSLDNVQILFLPDLDDGEDENSVMAALEDNASQIDDLHQSIEGSAMFYHAIDSRQILVRDVVALEFDGDDVVVFVRGARPAAAE